MMSSEGKKCPFCRIRAQYTYTSVFSCLQSKFQLNCLNFDKQVLPIAQNMQEDTAFLGGCPGCGADKQMSWSLESNIKII